MELIIRLRDRTIDLDEVTAALVSTLARYGYEVSGIGFPGDIRWPKDPVDNRDDGQGGISATTLATEFVRLVGPVRPSEFWIAYPASTSSIGSVTDRVKRAWGVGATEEQALRRAGWEPESIQER